MTTSQSMVVQQPRFGILEGGETESQGLAKLITHSSACTATVQQFSGVSKKLDELDLLAEIRKAGDEVVAGKLGRFEHLLAGQALALDSLFHHLAQRAGRQDNVKHLELLLRLALKAQSQARATVEALSGIKHPTPYIRQANIAHGHQQVNNAGGGAGAEI